MLDFQNKQKKRIWLTIKSRYFKYYIPNSSDMSGFRWPKMVSPSINISIPENEIWNNSVSLVQYPMIWWFGVRSRWVGRFKETTLERADSTLRLLKFATAEKERSMSITFFLSSSCQQLSPRCQAKTGQVKWKLRPTGLEVALSNVVSLCNLWKGCQLDGYKTGSSQ